MNILAFRGDFPNFSLGRLAFDLEEQGGDPPDLAKAGFFHPLHQGRVRVSKRDFRGAFVG
jgi:hypothetical protein